MLPKYTVEYTTQFRKHAQTNHYSTDDPVACEEFVEELLERGFAIRAIKHEGVEVPGQDLDKIVKTAAGMLASRRICASLAACRTSMSDKLLSIKSEEQHYRFGFAA